MLLEDLISKSSEAPAEVVYMTRHTQLHEYTTTTKEQHADLIFMLIKNREQIVLCIMQNTSGIISCTTGNQLGQNPTGTCFVFLFFFLRLCLSTSRELLVYCLDGNKRRLSMEGLKLILLQHEEESTPGYHFYKRMLTLCAAVTQVGLNSFTTSGTQTVITDLLSLFLYF